jgi:predicted RNase H-like HicB family nuclease
MSASTRAAVGETVQEAVTRAKNAVLTYVAAWNEND